MTSLVLLSLVSILFVCCAPGISSGRSKQSDGVDEYINDWIPGIKKRLVKRQAEDSGNADHSGNGDLGVNIGGGNPKSPKITKTPATKASKSPTAVHGISDNCLQCIHQRENGEAGCHMDGKSEACGPYQIHEAYWVDCGKPGGSWKGCAATVECSETCTRTYLNKKGQACVGPNSVPTCEDYAGVHNGGPNACRSASTTVYRAAIAKCCAGTPGGC